MTAKYIQTEDGNITVAAIGKNLLVAIGGQIYLVTNPAIGDEINGVKEVDYLPGDTPERLFQRIGTIKNEPGNGILK
jgi:hypothetical protein